MPILTIFGGPNGAGKSSIIRLVDFQGSDHLLEADAIAARVHASNPRMAAIEAGREVLGRSQEYVRCGQDHRDHIVGELDNARHQRSSGAPILRTLARLSFSGKVVITVFFPSAVMDKTAGGVVPAIAKKRPGDASAIPTGSSNFEMYPITWKLTGGAFAPVWQMAGIAPNTSAIAQALPIAVSRTSEVTIRVP